MSDPTTLLGYEMQAQSTPGWWDNLNAALQAIDDSIAGSVLLNTTGGDTALSLTPYVADQSRLPVIRIGSGGNPITANIRITSLRKREYLVTNETTSGAFTVSFGYDTSNQVTIPRGYQCRIRNTADGGSIRTSPLVTIAAAEIYADDIPEISSAMLSSALQTTINTAASNAASAVSTASTALATANATAALVVTGTESTAGILRLASAAEVVTGTDTAKAATAAGVKAHVDGRIASQAEAIAGVATKLMTAERVAQAMVGATNPTYALIGTVTPSGGQTTVEFGSLSLAAYSKIIISFDTLALNGNDNLVLGLSDDNGSSYKNLSVLTHSNGSTDAVLRGDDEGPSAGPKLLRNTIETGVTDAAGTIEIWFPGVASTVKQGRFWSGNSVGGSWDFNFGALYSASMGAITRVKLSCLSGSGFTAGNVRLYGIK
jgi:hypothetical protein